MADDRVARAASPVTVLVAEAVEPAAIRPSLLASFVRFCVTGLCSLGADFGLLYGLHSGAGFPLSAATVIGSLAAVTVNYTLNRNWTFQATAGHGYTMTRYAFMVGVNFGSTLLIVLGLSHLGLYYLLSKLIAVAVNAGSNFLAARYWVFRH